MASITLKVIDGADRGKVFPDLGTPVTIGREEGNSIQLNDERVSRFHLKIQEDQEKVVLTDLESTNGTKVNGEDVQLKILRYGDRIAIGRSVLWFGSREQIAQRLRAAKSGEADPAKTLTGADLNAAIEAESLDFELDLDRDAEAPVHSLFPPELPERLSPGQAAQFCEVLEYFHVRMRALIELAKSDDKNDLVTLDARQWQNMIDLQSQLATYLRAVSEPDA